MAGGNDDKWRRYEAQLHVFATHLAAVTDFAALAIKSIILGNGAAAVAVLAFLGAVWGKPEAPAVASQAIESIKIFGAGVFAAMLSGAFSYFAQYSYSKADLADEKSRAPKNWIRFGASCHVVAVISALLGVLSFAYGAWVSIEALSEANGGIGKIE